jgi:hypothetical protein
MKRYLIALVFTFVTVTVFAQDTIPPKVYRNEFGIDATGFIKQFLNFSNDEFPVFYSETYYLTYRRHLKSGNIRAAVGGGFADYDIPTPFAGDSNIYHFKSYNIDYRVGWEFTNELSKRWQVFYGADFRHSLMYTKNDAPFWNGGYANGSESKVQSFGLAPLLGIRFRINNRISLSTETSFSINLEQAESRRYYLPVTSQYPPLTDQMTPKSNRIISRFNAPLSLFFTFDI